MLDSKDWKANWIGIQDPEPSDWARPRYLRKTFQIKQAVRRATLYASALYFYELHINGQRVRDHLLPPEWANYYKRVQYQAYDVTNLVRTGANTLGALLGNGWYCGGWQHCIDRLKAIYGIEPLLFAQLEIEYADGSPQKCVSDDTWHGTTDGPLRFSGINEGVT